MYTDDGKDWWESIPTDQSVAYPLPTEEVKETDNQNEPLPVPGGPEDTVMISAACESCGGYHGWYPNICTSCDGSGKSTHFVKCPVCHLSETMEADAGSYGQAVTFSVLHYQDDSNRHSSVMTYLREKAPFCPHCVGKLYADSEAELKQRFEDNDDRCQEQLEGRWHDEELEYHAAQAAGDQEADSDE